MPKDVFGVYETTFTYVEPDNGKTYELRKYVNSGKIKNLGVCMLFSVRKTIA